MRRDAYLFFETLTEVLVTEGKRSEVFIQLKARIREVLNDVAFDLRNDPGVDLALLIGLRIGHDQASIGGEERGVPDIRGIVVEDRLKRGQQKTVGVVMHKKRLLHIQRAVIGVDEDVRKA